jgi:hypothetical protein
MAAVGQLGSDTVREADESGWRGGVGRQANGGARRRLLQGARRARQVEEALTAHRISTSTPGASRGSTGADGGQPSATHGTVLETIEGLMENVSALTRVVAHQQSMLAQQQRALAQQREDMMWGFSQTAKAVTTAAQGAVLLAGMSTEAAAGDNREMTGPVSLPPSPPDSSSSTSFGQEEGEGSEEEQRERLVALVEQRLEAARGRWQEDEAAKTVQRALRRRGPQLVMLRLRERRLQKEEREVRTRGRWVRMTRGIEQARRENLRRFIENLQSARAVLRQEAQRVHEEGWRSDAIAFVSRRMEAVRLRARAREKAGRVEEVWRRLTCEVLQRAQQQRGAARVRAQEAGRAAYAVALKAALCADGGGARESGASACGTGICGTGIAAGALEAVLRAGADCTREAVTQTEGAETVASATQTTTATHETATQVRMEGSSVATQTGVAEVREAATQSQGSALPSETNTAAMVPNAAAMVPPVDALPRRSGGRQRRAVRRGRRAHECRAGEGALRRSWPEIVDQCLAEAGRLYWAESARGGWAQHERVR